MSIVNKTMTDFAVIGLGKFGSAITRELYSLGKEVLAIDMNEDKINSISDFTTHAVVADSSDEQAMMAIGLRNFDAVIICLGTNMQASILTTLICKEQGAPFVIAKANSKKHKEVLNKIGANLVVQPEEEMAHKLAVQLVTPHLNNIMELDEKFTIAQTDVPGKWENKTLLDLDMRRKYGITLLVIKSGDNVLVSPGGDAVLRKGDSILIGGDPQTLGKFIDKLALMK